MKEEFVSGLIGGGQLCGGGMSSVCQSSVKRLALDGACGETGDRSRTSCKRVKTTQVNGFIVYTRTRRTKFTKINEVDENAGFSENRMSNHLEESKPTNGVTNFSGDMSLNNSIAETNASGSSCINNINVENPAEKIAVEERFVTGSLAENMKFEKFKELDTETDSSSLVDVVIEDIQFVEMLHEEIPVEILSEGSLDFELKRIGTKYRTMGKPYCVSEDNRHGSLKRTSQIYKSVLRVKKVNNLVPEDVEALVEPDFDLEELDEQSHSVSLADKSNLICKRPATVRELFETGILDGVPVVYMGTVKSQAFGLRGIIKDGGILCSCTFCDWTKVISTSKFEIHACKQYRRASQYICFENGKSLLDVLTICKTAPLHALKATILDAVDSVSKGKCFTCKRCKGVFPLSSLGHRGVLCLSCTEVENSRASPAATSTSTSTPTCITSPDKSRLNITRKEIRQALVGKAYLSTSANVSSQKKCKSKMLTQRSVTPKALKVLPLSVSSKKRSCRITRKDHGLHKLVFERGGLPDGTNLGYYARGQVAYLILCVAISFFTWLSLIRLYHCGRNY